VEEFRRTYYRPVNELLETFPSRQERIADVEVRAVYAESADLFVVISADLFERAIVAPDRIGRAALQDVNQNADLGGDGIYVRLGESWSDELMRLQPQERSTQ
jgi:hypothetical protein